MFHAFSLAFGQLSDPRIRRVVWISVAVTIVVYLLLCGGLAWLMFDTQLISSLPLWDTILDWASVIVVPIAALFLFPMVVTGVMGAFLEQVVDAVEDRYMPGLTGARPQPMVEVLISSLRLIGLSLVLNLILLPLYLLFPVVGQVAFFLVNGYLVAREYFEMVALRRLPPDRVKVLRGAYRGRLLLTGAVITLMLTIPILNLLAPVIGVAAMTHVAHGLPDHPLSIPSSESV